MTLLLSPQTTLTASQLDDTALARDGKNAAKLVKERFAARGLTY